MIFKASKGYNEKQKSLTANAVRLFIIFGAGGGSLGYRLINRMINPFGINSVQPVCNDK